MLFYWFLGLLFHTCVLFIFILLVFIFIWFHIQPISLLGFILFVNYKYFLLRDRKTD
jgi:hypothetical protein